MKNQNKRSWLGLLDKIAAEEHDDENTRLQKSLLVLFSMIMANMVPLWSVIYWYYDAVIAAFIPLDYSLLSYLSFAFFILIL